jgi:hypothetical protein
MVTLNRETERKKMGSVFIIEEQVDYEGDTVVSIHATRQGALCVLDRKHAELAELGTVGLQDMQNGNFRVRDRVFQMTEKPLEA